MTQPAPPSPKKASHKKRHTKPCRYFQLGNCPHKAQEDCDFAHVYSDPPVSLPPPKQCRYYLQGNCTNGIWCQYLHGEASAGSDDHSLLKDYQNINSLSGRVIEFSPNTVHMRVGVPPAVYMPHQFNGMHVAQSAWSYPVEFVPPPQLLLPNPVVSPAASSPDSFDFATPSSSPTSSDRSDDGILPTVDDVPGQHYPSYFPAEPQHGGVRMGTTIPSCPTRRPACRSLSCPRHMGWRLCTIYSAPRPRRPRASTLPPGFCPNHTKPCRYIKAGVVCPNGDACTFIHAHPEKINEEQPPSPPLEPAKQLQHELPSKPLSAKEENTRKGYFPISWRVIGGGVLLSGAKDKSEPSDDDDLSDLSEDSESFDGRADPVSYALEIEIPRPRRRIPSPFPRKHDAHRPPRLARQRASSIPSTPISTHVDHLRLFSAESPGGL
ncbi:hypothetical protein B0H13DRAFT_2064838 [Mycena leptocephala]|nr:hypothetical protein B0H13DRAFT_2064838 [Mycena leptocephala]